MNITLEWIDVIIFIGICQGVFLTLTLQRITNTNRTANNILSILIVMATVMLIGRFVYFRFLTYWVFQWSILVDAIVFLFGPLIYTYVRRLLFKDNETFRLPSMHFIPFLGMTAFALFHIIFSTPEEYYQFYLHGNLLLYFRIISILMIASNLFYVIKSYQLLRQFKASEKGLFSFGQSTLRYVNLFLLAVLASLILWVVSLMNSMIFNGSITYIGYDSIWVAIPVFIYVIGYFSLKQPELFRIAEERKVSASKKERLSPQESKILGDKLDSLMINEKIFLQSDLTLSDVALLLQTSNNNLSWLLNQVYQSTFYDFINKYRVAEFVDKINKREHLKHTILALSMDVGFNSKSTFNKAFKDTMNDTPSNYIKKYLAA